MNYSEINIPAVPIGRITQDVISKTDLILKHIAVETNIREAEEQIAKILACSSGLIRGYKKELRRLFAIPDRASIAHLASHPQIKQALEFILTRKERADKLQLRGAKKLDVIMPTGEVVSVENFLKSLYPNENVNAISCYRALVARCKNKKVIKEDGSEATLADLPADVSVVRFLRQWKREFIAVRRARARKNDWEKKQQMFVTRDMNNYAADQIWMSDHTELDHWVYDENGKMRRRWITAFKDLRSGAWRGYHLSWQPNSQTIALAFRNAVLGKQLLANVENEYKECGYIAMPEEVWMDNGKDYRSKHLQKVFGKIDFDDIARRSLARITKLHYVQKYHGQSKAQIERGWGVLNNLLKNLPAFKGSMARVNQPDTLKEDIRQGNILSVEEFDKMVALAINVLNNRITRTLGNETPIQHLLTHQIIQRTIDIRVLDFLMMKVEEKKISRCEVQLKNVKYYSDQLMAFNGKKADIYYDPTDLGFVSVYVDGEFAAVACNKDLIGKDERGWQRILADRTRSEKEMREQIAGFRNGLSKADARMMLLHGELMNTQPVDAALLVKETPAMIIRTGFEEQANETQKHLDQERVKVDVEQRAKKKKSAAPLTMDLVSRIR